MYELFVCESDKRNDNEPHAHIETARVLPQSSGFVNSQWIEPTKYCTLPRYLSYTHSHSCVHTHTHTDVSYNFYIRAAVCGLWHRCLWWRTHTRVCMYCSVYQFTYTRWAMRETLKCMWTMSKVIPYPHIVKRAFERLLGRFFCVLTIWWVTRIHFVVYNRMVLVRTYSCGGEWCFNMKIEHFRRPMAAM